MIIDSYHHPTLGTISVQIHPRAHSVIMRAQTDGVKVTIPPYITRQRMKEVIEQHAAKLLSQQQSLRQAEANPPAEPSITPHFVIQNDLIHLHFQQGERKDFYWHSQPGETVIFYPADTDFGQNQEWLRRVIEQALRQQGQWLLPNRLRQLSEQHNLPFNLCKINVSKGRWGSCSNQNNINLSCYLMTLPPHLRDYVMLHELCHTREMNHGPQFWKLLNELTGGEAQTLRHELRQHHTGV